MKTWVVDAPDDTCGVDTLKKDQKSLHRLYEKGYPMRTNKNWWKKEV